MSEQRPLAEKPEQIEQVAQLAMRLSRPHLADYGASRSRHDFTQRQLLSSLILRAYLKTTYRGVLEVLASSATLRHHLGLRDKLPHFTTLQKFSGRSRVVAIVQALLARLGSWPCNNRPGLRPRWIRRSWRRPLPAPISAAGRANHIGDG